MRAVVDRERAGTVLAETFLVLKARQTGNAYRRFQEQYYNDPAGFARDCVLWPAAGNLVGYQTEILGDLVKFGRECDRGPHGLGKTTSAAIACLWFALTRDGKDWKCITTASAWRQLTKYLWPEIHKWARRLKWEIIGRAPFDRRLELLQNSLKLETGEAFAVASDDSATIEGAHADHLFYIFDEAKTIPEDTWDAAEGAFSGPGEVFALAISTPGEPVGRFYDIQSRKAGFEDWHVRHVTLEEAIATGRITKQWADQRKAQWREESAVYQNRVLGEFASSEEEGIVPLSWVERSNLRWLAWKDAGSALADFYGVGVDVARSGEDKTTLGLRFGRVISEIRSYAKADTMETTGRVKGVLDLHGGRAVVDVVGIGAGVVDRLREQRCRVEAFNAGAHTDFKDKSGELGFADLRSAAWWNLREMLEADEIDLPPDDELTGDLTAPHWKPQSGGKIKVESKDEMRGRLGRSTDKGDCVMMIAFTATKSVPAWWLQ